MNVLKSIVLAVSLLTVGCAQTHSSSSSVILAQRLKDSTAELVAIGPQGSFQFTGVFLEYNGKVYVLSVAHGLVENEKVSDLVMVNTSGPFNHKDLLPASVVKCQADFKTNGYDLSLLYVPGLCPDDVHTTKLRTEPVQMGEALQTVGHPTVSLNQATPSYNTLRWFYSTGVVSSESMYIRGNKDPVFAFFSPVYPGQSGSGVFDADGKLVGILLGSLGGSYSIAVPVDNIITWSHGSDAEEVIAGSTLR